MPIRARVAFTLAFLSGAATVVAQPAASPSQAPPAASTPRILVEPDFQASRDGNAPHVADSRPGHADDPEVRERDG
jgi:hypothetical protein